MIFLNIAIILFIVLETTNIAIIYFDQDFKYGNSMSVFKFYKESKEKETTRLFVDYMSNWVANSKFIFIILLIIILITGSEISKLVTIILLIPSIALYYIRLHPIIKKLDNLGEIKPKGYSKILLITITGIIIMLIFCILLYCITN